MEVKADISDVANETSPMPTTSSTPMNPAMKKNNMQHPGRGGKKVFQNRMNKPPGGGMNNTMRGNNGGPRFEVNQKISILIACFRHFKFVSHS